MSPHAGRERIDTTDRKVAPAVQVGVENQDWDNARSIFNRLNTRKRAQYRLNPNKVRPDLPKKRKISSNRDNSAAAEEEQLWANEWATITQAHDPLIEEGSNMMLAQVSHNGIENIVYDLPEAEQGELFGDFDDITIAQD